MVAVGLVAVWLALYLALLLLGAVVAASLFPHLAERGAGLGLSVALAIVGIVTYVVGHVSLSAGLWLGVAVLALAAVATRLRGDIPNRRATVEAALVFTAAFLFMVAVRAVDPAVHPGGGEKFLDFGLLNSLLRTTRLPPEDMWFAGEPVQYYYGGHLLASLLTRLTGTAPRFAYNLAHAGFYAMLVTAAYGLAREVAAGQAVPRRLAGGLTVLFTAVASNLSTPGRVVLWLLPDGTAAAVAGPLGLADDALEWTPDAFFYWDASRIIPGTVNEFPLFAWMNGDMHAHMMSTPFLLLVATLCYAYYRADPGARRYRVAILFGAIPPVAGLLAVANTWSFPTVAGLVGLAVLFAPATPRSLAPESVTDALPSLADRPAVAREPGRIAGALLVAAGVLALGVLWSLPFWLGTASGRDVAFLPDRSSFGELLLVHGGFLLVFVPFLARRVWPAIRRNRVLTLAAAAAAVFAVSTGYAAVGLFGPVLVVAWLALALRRSSGGDATTGTGSGADSLAELADVDFETVLVLAGVGLVVLVEFVYIVEEAGPERFNTVFKTYMQVWVLWAPAAGVALARLLVADRPSVGPATPGGADGRWRRVAAVLAVVVLLSTSLYAGFALPAHFEGSDETTLDAMKFVERTHPEEAAAIDWVNDRRGQPTIVTMPGCWCNPGSDLDPYRWANAPSSLTGVPTVAGWSHEVGYRGRDVYRNRVSDVRTIYTGSPERQRELLATYGVRYVYVGENERALYGEEISVADVEAVGSPERLGNVTIYRVDHDRLDA